MTGKTKGSGGEAVVGEAGQRIGAQAVTIRERNAELTAGMPCDPFKYPFIHSHVNRFLVITQEIAVYSIASIQIPLYYMPSWNLSFSWNTVFEIVARPLSRTIVSPSCHNMTKQKVYKAQKTASIRTFTTLCPPSICLLEPGRVFLISTSKSITQASPSLATLALFQGNDGFLDSSASYIHYTVSFPVYISDTLKYWTLNSMPAKQVASTV